MLTPQRADELYGTNDPGPSDVNDTTTIAERRNDEQKAALIARARQCFESTRGQLRSPNGTIIHLNLITASNNKSNPGTTITIGERSMRPHSRSWSGRASCATMIHETMHLLGLADAYHENAITNPNANPTDKTTRMVNGTKVSGNFMYDCRFVEPERSIMHNHELAMGQYRSVIVCPKNGTQNSHQVQNLPERCPDGSQPMRRYERSSPEEFESMRRLITNDRIMLYSNIIPDGLPLSDDQTLFITNPGCRNLNRTYIQRSANAQRTSSVEGCLP